MTKYKYKGDFCIVTINNTDYILIDGREYELPDNHKKVKQFIKQKKLHTISKPKKERVSQSSKGACSEQATGTIDGLCKSKAPQEQKESK